MKGGAKSESLFGPLLSKISFCVNFGSAGGQDTVAYLSCGILVIMRL